MESKLKPYLLGTPCYVVFLEYRSGHYNVGWEELLLVGRLAAIVASVVFVVLWSTTSVRPKSIFGEFDREIRRLPLFTNFFLGRCFKFNLQTAEYVSTKEIHSRGLFLIS